MIENDQIKNIHRDKLKDFCNTITYPIYYLSINSFEEQVNIFKEKETFKYIPFQYSLHIEYRNGIIEHKEFISDSKYNAKYQFTQQLCKDISLDSTVITDNIEILSSLLDDLSTSFLEYSYHLLILKENIKDLILPFKNEWTNLIESFYDSTILDENGYFSKTNNSKLEETYLSLFQNKNEEKESVKNYLLSDCKNDTAQMVEVFKKLKMNK